MGGTTGAVAKGWAGTERERGGGLRMGTDDEGEGPAACREKRSRRVDRRGRPAKAGPVCFHSTLDRPLTTRPLLSRGAQGFSVHVTLVCLARHTKEVADSLSCKSGRVSLAEETAWDVARDSNHFDDLDLFNLHPDLLMTPRPDAAGANRLAWCLLRLRRVVQSQEGREELSKHAVGVRGSVLHGAPSCLLVWIFKLLCPCKPSEKGQPAPEA